MNNMQIFNSPEFGDIRTVMIDGEPWFVGKDISIALGYSKTFSMSKLVEDEDKRVISSSVLEEQVGKQSYQIGIINESGLYAAIFGSKLESAKKFKRWVTSEVLPQLRRTGTYGGKRLPESPIELLELHYQAIKEVNGKVDMLSGDLNAVRNDLESFKADMPILGIEESKITSAVKKTGVGFLGGKTSNAYQNKSLRAKLYADIYGQLKREFGVSTYKAIKRNQTDVALRVIEGYKPPLVISQAVAYENAQEKLFA